MNLRLRFTLSTSPISPSPEARMHPRPRCGRMARMAWLERAGISFLAMLLCFARGLDPRVCAPSKAAKRDPRVKPGDDSGGDGAEREARAPRLCLVGTGNCEIITRLRHPTPTYPASPAGLTRGSVPPKHALQREIPGSSPGTIVEGMGQAYHGSLAYVGGHEREGAMARQ